MPSLTFHTTTNRNHSAHFTESSYNNKISQMVLPFFIWRFIMQLLFVSHINISHVWSITFDIANWCHHTAVPFHLMFPHGCSFDSQMGCQVVLLKTGFVYLTLCHMCGAQTEAPTRNHALQFPTISKPSLVFCGAREPMVMQKNWKGHLNCQALQQPPWTLQLVE